MPAADDPRGVADAPCTAPMQVMADALRCLSVRPQSPEHTAATAKASAEMMELMIDWLLDQHRLIVAQAKTVHQLHGIVLEMMKGKP